MGDLQEQLRQVMRIFGERVRKEYALMLSYLVGVRNNWEHVNPGKHYTNAKHTLPLNEARYYDTLMAVVTLKLGVAALLDVPTVILAVISILLVFKYKINSSWLILFGGIIGLLLTII